MCNKVLAAVANSLSDIKTMYSGQFTYNSVLIPMHDLIVKQQKSIKIITSNRVFDDLFTNRLENDNESKKIFTDYNCLFGYYQIPVDYGNKIRSKEGRVGSYPPLKSTIL